MPPTTTPSPARTAFDELGRLSFAEHSLESVLQRVTALAARVLPGEPVTSVTVIDRGRPSTAAASGELALTLDETQYRLGNGPCVSAADDRPAQRARRHARRRGLAGVRRRRGRDRAAAASSPSPSRPPEQVSGALNVYGREFPLPDRRSIDAVARVRRVRRRPGGQHVPVRERGRAGRRTCRRRWTPGPSSTRPRASSWSGSS